MVLPQADAERDREHDAADDQARAQLFEMIHEAEPVLVADRADALGHGPDEPSTARACGRGAKAPWPRASMADVRASMNSDKDPDTTAPCATARAASSSTSSTATTGQRADEPPTRPGQLHVCFHCAGELVYPLDWSEEGPVTGGSCCAAPSASRAARASSTRPPSNSLDDELDRGSGALLGDLRRMTHANMTEEVEFFVRALDADLIVPSDF